MRVAPAASASTGGLRCPRCTRSLPPSRVPELTEDPAVNVLTQALSPRMRVCGEAAGSLDGWP
eukprot:363437-Chlamydomonas_euryale.AAC.3